MVLNVNNTPRARVAWLSPDAGLAGEGPDASLCDALEEAGYGVRRLFRLGRTEKTTPRADIVIIDLRNSPAPEEDATRLTPIARRTRAVCEPILLVPTATAAATRAELEPFGEPYYLWDDAKAVVALVRERLRGARIAEEAGERLKSLAAIDREGAPTTGRPADRQCSVLIAGAPTHRALPLINELNACRTVSVLSASQVLRALETEPFDALIVLPTDKTDLLYALSRALRRHRDLSRMPIIVVSSDAEALSAFAALGCTPLDDRHLDADAARRVAAMIERGRTNATLRRYLRRTVKTLRRDRETQLRFFACHAARLAERSLATGRPLSLIGIADPENTPKNHLPIKRASQNDRQPTDNVETIAARVVRAEDCVLRLGSDGIIVLAPNTRAGDAAKMSARLAGVIAGRATERSAGERGPEERGVEERGANKPSRTANTQGSATRARLRTRSSARERTAAIEWRPGETPDRFLVRLYSALHNAANGRAAAP